MFFMPEGLDARMKKIFCRLLAVLLCQGALFAGTPSFYNILDFGARPGGCEQAHIPINAAIEAAHAAGGGPNMYLSSQSAISM